MKYLISQNYSLNLETDQKIIGLLWGILNVNKLVTK
jgi:hypothetical protein